VQGSTGTLAGMEGTPFKEMKPGRKFVWVLKVVVCALSFGMLFPNVMSD
jgi:hypothetical protein